MCTKESKKRVSTESTTNKTLDIYTVFPHKNAKYIQINYFIHTITGVTIGSKFPLCAKSKRQKKAGARRNLTAWSPHQAACFYITQPSKGKSPSCLSQFNAASVMLHSVKARPTNRGHFIEVRPVIFSFSGCAKLL